MLVERIVLTEIKIVIIIIISKHLLFEKLRFWKLDVELENRPHKSKYGVSFHPEVNLPLIMRMRSGNNNMNRQFQGKTPQSILTSNCRPSWDPQLHLVGGLILLRGHPTWLAATIVKNRYDVITPPWFDLFGRDLVR